MKLKFCHVENYGALSCADFDFNGDITEFLKKNGYGKTTLASFLKAAFYGLDSARSNGSFNERKHFTPFSGGNFGGYVTFEAGGKEYKIERYFSDKSDRGDTLTVYENGVERPDIVNAGEYFFGIDRQSFERTAFIDGSDTEICSTGSINARLNAFLAGGEQTDITGALEILEKAGKEYKKSKGGNDLITREGQKTEELKRKIADLQSVSSGLAQKYADYEKLCRASDELKERVTKAQTLNAVLKDWERYDEVLKEAETYKAQADNIAAAYPMGLPQESEVRAVEEVLSRNRELKAAAGGQTFTAGDGERLYRLKVEFGRGVPSDEDMEKAGEELKRAEMLGYKLGELSAERTDADLAHKFKRAPTDEEQKTLSARLEKYKALQRDIAAQNAAAQPKKADNKRLVITFFALIFLLAVAGGITAVFYLAEGLILLFTALAIGLGAACFYFAKRPQRAGTSAGLISAQAEADEAAEGIKAYLMPYGYSFENGIPYAVASFFADLEKYNKNLEEEKGRKEEYARTEEERAAALKEVKNFLGGFGLYGEDLHSLLNRLTADKNALSELEKRRAEAESSKEEYNKKIAENLHTVEGFCKKYGFDPGLIEGRIKEIGEDIKCFSAAEAAHGKRVARAAEIKESKNLFERPLKNEEDVAALNGEWERIQDRKNALHGEILNDEKDAEGLGALKNELEEAKERLKEYKEKYGLICMTADFIKEADRRLTEKYVKPVKDGYLRYINEIERELGEKITLNADFELRYEKEGAERSSRHLSAGQKCMCALCFRLALIDNMYSGEKPFIILDDPFAGLDEEHLKKALNTVKKLSSEVQMIYFTCHKSRTVV